MTQEVDLKKDKVSFDEIDEIQDFEQMFELFEKNKMDNPYFRLYEDIANNTIKVKTKEIINFGSYNYLGFSGDARVKETAKKAIDDYGTTVSATRSIAGDRQIHRVLEEEIADFLGVDDSMVIISGYTTNFTTIGHLFHRKDIIFYDESSHNSIVQGAYLSKATMVPFAHNDVNDLERLLKEKRELYQKALIVTEGIFSVSGDIPELPMFIELKNKYRAFLMVDEAHSFGVLGDTGRGITEYWKVNPKDVDILMGTLSKTLASCGGYIAGSKLLVKYFKYTLPGFIFSVGITPANTGAALASLRLLKQHPELIKKLQDNARYFIEQAGNMRLDTGKSYNSGVISILIGDSIKAMRVSNYLYENGVNVAPMIAPTVPEGKAKLRFFIVAGHTKEQIKYTLEKTKEAVIKLI